MLKLHADDGRDYLDYLRPFVQQAIFDARPDRVTDHDTSRLLRDHFGLVVPPRTIQIVLRRLAREGILNKESGIYVSARELVDPGLGEAREQAKRHIRSIVLDLVRFAAEAGHDVVDEARAEGALTAFLAELDVSSLRAFLRGTAIPHDPGSESTAIRLVGQYVTDIALRNPAVFESFLVVVTGHMLANALLCPDLIDAPKTFSGVSFYLDTPLVLRALGHEGDERQHAATETIELLVKLGGRVLVFEHTVRELSGVLTGAANWVDRTGGRGGIIAEARRSRITKSDLMLSVARLDEDLAQFGLEVVKTPRHEAKYQIDEIAFEQALADDDVDYLNPRARDYDTQSVRAIYVLRAGRIPRNLESSIAVLVTSNAGLAHAAYEFGKEHEEAREVSSVITDFTLANVAWLKAPMSAPDLPRAEVLAFAYGALAPPKGFVEKLERELDRLESSGRITPRDHQLMRSTQFAQDELMRGTLGDETALSEERISQVLERVKDELVAEERAAKIAVEVERDRTRVQLDETTSELHRLKTLHEDRQKRTAKMWASIVVGAVATASTVGLGFGVIGPSTVGALRIFLVLCAFIGLAVSAASIIRELTGARFPSLYTWCYNALLSRLQAKTSA